ncbi:sulfatase-like hydrolase/transferase [Marinobacter sp. C2H3]|uniref:sulfatase-like hydrolase/transferase n=1 Tax=Marinobacter sp. C2H3 TaxID=3119003 RepID=UPI00300F0805
MKRFLASALLLNLLLIALSLPAYPQVPLVAAEAILLIGVCLWLPPGRPGVVVRLALGLVYVLLALFSAADALIRESLARPLNLYLDAGLAGAVVNQFTANLGPVLSVLVAVVLIAMLLAVAGLLAWLLKGLAHAPRNPRWLAPLLVLLAIVLTLLPPGRQPPGVASTAWAFGERQVHLAEGSAAATRAFAEQLARRDRNGQDQPVPLVGLGNADVVLGFIESYGMTNLLDDRYRPLIEPRLNQMQQALDEAGLQVVSGRLRAPVQGGQSWLAHATLLSGLWVNSQLDFDTLLATGRTTLIDDFKATGHHTVAVMPAITGPWPEGDRLGYDEIHDAAHMDYQGPALNWVTMPDQYTWTWFDRTVRQPSQAPVFAELALISSHAPWVPILPVLDDWSEIGDGRVFEPWRNSGEAPVSLWKDYDRVRDHYVRSIDYALNVVTGYATRHVDGQTLLIILGDHQPAPLVTGDNATRDVPVHIISGDPDLLAPFVGGGADGQPGLPSFRAGTFPELSTEGVPMDRFRGFLQQAFGATQGR